jgi:hypothetical protein
MKATAATVLAALLLALGWLARGWLSPVPAPVYEVTSIVRDTVKYEVHAPAPLPRYEALPPDTVFRAVDTAAILLAYLTERFYSDTLLNDTSAFIALSETVSRNAIADRRLTFQNRRPTYITTTVVQQPPEMAIYISLLAGRSLAAPMAHVAWRRWQVSAGYNLTSGGMVVGVGYKIH